MKPNLQLFKLETLHLVDTLAADFDRQIEQAVKDCLDRPGLKRARKVAITVEIEPATNGEDVMVTVQTTNRMPTRCAETYRMMTTRNAGLKFNPASPSDPNQQTMDFDG